MNTRSSHELKWRKTQSIHALFLQCRIYYVTEHSIWNTYESDWTGTQNVPHHELSQLNVVKKSIHSNKSRLYPSMYTQYTSVEGPWSCRISPHSVGEEGNTMRSMWTAQYTIHTNINRHAAESWKSQRFYIIFSHKKRMTMLERNRNLRKSGEEEKLHWQDEFSSAVSTKKTRLHLQRFSKKKVTHFHARFPSQLYSSYFEGKFEVT